MNLTTTTLDTPVGPLVALFEDASLRMLEFADGAKYPSHLHAEASTPKNHPGPSRLRAYFDGDLEALDTIEAEGAGTLFQKKVWAALRKIKVGSTQSYGALAESIGSPTAFRAVASANARNPIAIVVPCHRVIGSDGRLSGYGGGVERKRWLLVHEGALLG
ncbi:MAG: methylated-DNA--[protein]-cysteine S-methyltransferase [Thermoanaerobaculia bacterium]